MGDNLSVNSPVNSLVLSRQSLVGLLVTGMGAALAAAAHPSAPDWSSVASMSAGIAGLILIGVDIAKSPRNKITLLIAVAASLLARAATHPEWDSAQLLFKVMAFVAAFAFVILLLPRPLQMVVASRLAVFHFFGVMSAITSPPPQSWLSHWAWVTLFRPHLVFCYTNNAYQFYSPQPGPASLLWFCIEMQDGTKTWFKQPRKPETRLDPLSVEFFRRLSMTEAVNQNQSISTISIDAISARRSVADWIPMYPGASDLVQFRPPQPHVRRTLATYVRHVFEMFGGPKQVKSVRVYRVLHTMLEPQQFANGDDPFAESTYWPYYFGEYSADGTIVEPNDPLLFWLIPIYRKPPTVTPTARTGMDSVHNYLKRHAGSDPFEDRYGGAP